LGFDEGNSAEYEADGDETGRGIDQKKTDRKHTHPESQVGVALIGRLKKTEKL
jgi:hypothetical protein